MVIRFAAHAAASLILLLALTGSSAAATPSRSAAQAQTPDQLAGQRVIFCLPGHRAPRSLLTRIARGEAAGVILFARNISSHAQLQRLTRARDDVHAGVPVSFSVAPVA